MTSYLVHAHGWSWLSFLLGYGTGLLTLAFALLMGLWLGRRPG